MAYVLALHLISVVCWFAGLFYLPRLFVYHAMNHNEDTKTQFRIMEHKLYYYIMMPAMLATLITGLVLLVTYAFAIPAPPHLGWLWLKLALVLVLVLFHFYCGHCLHEFKAQRVPHTHRGFRMLNEVPTVILILVMILAVVRPF